MFPQPSAPHAVTRKASAPHAVTRKVLAAAAASMLLAAGCSAQPANPPAAPATSQENPYGHIHGMSVDPETGRILLATHNGLFDASGGSPERIGPVIDLMGFSSAGGNRFYASGHPGPESGLPDPAGLIRTEDGGKTWVPLSRQGESDFHALTVTRDGVVGYDGQLRMTRDLEKWTVAGTGVRPHSLAGTPTSTVVLATTEEGVQRSDDGGKTWNLPAGAPVLLVTAFADNSTAAGVAPDGTVHLSRDTGRTWHSAGAVTGRPAAIAAAPGKDNSVQIWVATTAGLEHSEDSGTTFNPLGK
ncbi:F510_1955 family glycosylhydrolase [Arthrobacter mobilis]|uniref:Exo-alpha-sialidase n=1 Tax=Arthrobacter mobilis TaxID=2724944 RepID=A0A7X6HC59_9MICC|nr:exo-alpha-sialidase [Arthrobacter mobilis]NKX53624.1 exo-alpha-sialidase [Arthrobacter mobilis]